MRRFQLAPGMVSEIIAHARAGYPEEVCGIISGQADRAIALYRGHNIVSTPRVAYELDTDTLMRLLDFEEEGLELAAIYHSHPSGPETPSPADVAQAYYPDAVYIICSLKDPLRPTVRGFRIVDGVVSEAELTE